MNSEEQEAFTYARSRLMAPEQIKVALLLSRLGPPNRTMREVIDMMWQAETDVAHELGMTLYGAKLAGVLPY